MDERGFHTSTTAIPTVQRSTTWDSNASVATIVTPPFTREDYTVGWICALPKEQSAALAMLDELHPNLPKISFDSNAYTLGSIGQHNIVITCLPLGEIGTNAAAGILTQLVNTFTSIRFCLMVGIGAGVPPKVELGDVVVSSPSGRFSGVVQWDYGKATRGGGFERTGSLERPPRALLTALAKLQGKHYLEEPKILEHIHGMERRYPKLKKSFTEPPPGQDPYQDQGWARWVAGKLWADASLQPTTTTARIPSNQNESKVPKIHYGLIASGNQVIKDSRLRDQIDRDLGGDVLCFEMEAAGLMNNFPCLVIRGICDFADEKKNNSWQSYAASVAAAYTKELLGFIEPNEVNGERRARDVLKQMNDTVRDTQRDVAHIRRAMDNEEDRKILDWLTKVDYGPQQSDFLRRRQDETGKWLLESREFQGWFNTRQQTLFCPGIPGAGKTILTSTVINELELKAKAEADLSIGIAYVYCNFQRANEQNAEDLLSSMLKQLAGGQVSIPPSVKSLYKRHIGKRTQPSLNDVREALHSVVGMYSRVFVVIDALDECQVSCRTNFLRELFSFQESDGINIFATSRIIPEIVEKFKVRNSISREIRAIPSDLTKYLEGHMEQLPCLVQRDPGLQKEIKLRILEAADGMFLLAQIYLNLLRDKMTKNEILNELEGFRNQARRAGDDQKIQALADAYGKIIKRIQQQKQSPRLLAMKTLFWLTFAKREITSLELACALGTIAETTQPDRGDLPDLGDIGRACAGLVTVDETSGIIRLVHYTTQEYLEKTQQEWFAGFERTIIDTCITYLSYNVFHEGFCDTDADFERRREEYPLYSYAASNWGRHIPKNMKDTDKIMGFLRSKKKVEASGQALMVVKRYSFHSKYSQEVPREVTGLHLAGYFGLKDIAEALLQLSESVNLKDSYGQTALWWASRNGHEAVVRLLLERGAWFEAADSIEGGTPLIWASRNEYYNIIRLLLEKGARVNATTKDGRTALCWAARNGKKAVAQLLLDGGAAINVADNDGRTPLSLAAFHTHNSVVQLLLERGGNVGENDNDGKVRLLATGVGRKMVEKLLFGQNAGTTVEKLKMQLDQALTAEIEENLKSFFSAVENGDETSVRRLLEKEAVKIDIPNENGRMPMSLAAEKGHEGILRLLLAEDSTKVDARDTGDGKTPLMWAVYSGYSALAGLLLEADADVKAKDADGAAALAWAVEGGVKATVQLLLDAGADVSARDDDGNTPIFSAVGLGNVTVMQQLLENGANLHVKNNNGLTPLFVAAGLGNEATMRLLLDKGIDVDARDEEGRTPLFFAATFGKLASVRLLLKRGADINLRDRECRTPLFSAIGAEDEAAVMWMLGIDGIDVDVVDIYGRTPLSWAAERGKASIAQKLLETGRVDPSFVDKEGRTALDWARLGKHGEEDNMVRLLLNAANRNMGVKRV